MIHPNYPAPGEVDDWCDGILGRAATTDATPVQREWTFATYPHVAAHGNPRERLLEFPSANGGTFHCFWQPAQHGPAPVLMHLPGYGAEFSAHPELVAAGFHVMHISPLGYNTPTGWPDDVDKANPLGTLRPVFPDTVASLGERGYCDWLTDACVAVRWARSQPEVQGHRFAFFGTSQGGGAALLLGSVHSGEGCRAVAADQAFMIGFPNLLAMDPREGFVAKSLACVPKADQPRAWRALGLIDNLCHAHRLTMPVFLGAATADTVLPPDVIEPLFHRLTGTRSFTVLNDQAHGYSDTFKQLTLAWFRSHV